MIQENIIAFHVFGLGLVIAMISAVVARHPMRNILMGAVGIYGIVAVLLRG